MMESKQSSEKVGNQAVKTAYNSKKEKKRKKING